MSNDFVSRAWLLRRFQVFERYAEGAKRVAFFGRYQASQYGAPEIKAERLLLGLFRSDRGLSRRVLGCGGPIKGFISSASAEITEESH